MVRRTLLLGALLACAILARPASAGIHTFPSGGSTVIGSVGFLGDEIGYFWDAGRGDSVEETWADSLASVTCLSLALDVPTNVLNSGAFVNWDVLLNGTLVGNFTVPEAFTGPLNYSTSFAPVLSIGGNYTVKLAVTNIVAVNAGSHTFAYAGDHQHKVTLSNCQQAVPEPGTLALLSVGLVPVLRRRRRA